MDRLLVTDARRPHVSTTVAPPALGECGANGYPLSAAREELEPTDSVILNEQQKMMMTPASMRAQAAHLVLTSGPSERLGERPTTRKSAGRSKLDSRSRIFSVRIGKLLEVRFFSFSP